MTLRSSDKEMVGGDCDRHSGRTKPRWMREGEGDVNPLSFELLRQFCAPERRRNLGEDCRDEGREVMVREGVDMGPLHS